MVSFRLAIAVSFAVALGGWLTTAFTTPLGAQEVEVKRFLGSWGGKGRIDFTDGRNEAITCRSYNTHRDEQLRLALRCASSAYKIEIRSKLSFDGQVIAGEWEERTFNAAGDVSGAVNGNALELKVEGGGFVGDMKIVRTKSELAYSIATEGISLKGVAVALKRLN